MAKTNLSKNFTLEELTRTDCGLANTPTSEEVARLTDLVTNVLQPVRDKLGKPIKINSGFRSEAVNKVAGGVSTSKHCLGEAADIETDNNAELFQTIRENCTFDQLIWERGNDFQPDWVHVSYHARDNRMEVLRMKVVNGENTYFKI